MTALSIDLHIIKRMQNYYKKILMPFKHRGKRISIYLNVAIVITFYSSYRIQDYEHLLPLLYTAATLKYLGVTLQSNLRYNRHFEDITAKTNHMLGLL